MNMFFTLNTDLNVSMDNKQYSLERRGNVLFTKLKKKKKKRKCQPILTKSMRHKHWTTLLSISDARHSFTTTLR